MTEQTPDRYEPAQHEAATYQRWLDAKAFAAVPDERNDRYVIMMPLPNVTGALHMGHAMDNVMQDLLIRWHRMQGHNTLWMPGTDHAGIATQAVIEKRLKELEGKTRWDVGREGLVERIWEWKEICEKRIVRQQQSMGCSCDWDRARFTMDPVCTRAVREAFYRLFEDGLIYRGDRLVNWDCHLQTAVSDDEVNHETVKGGFWHLRYPVIDRRPGEPEYVVVATTRPETMLGDTAVACHPAPSEALSKSVASVKERLLAADAGKDRDALEAELARLEARMRDVLPGLETFAAMARDGRKVKLPLMDREIPLIIDAWAKPELGSGCVKITPAHDPNDYDVWTRHKDAIAVINILNVDGSLNSNAGAYAGLDRFDARKRVVADMDALSLLHLVEDRDVEVGHSDRSKTPIEPFLSKQWFVRMGDVDGGILMGRGTANEFRASGLAQAAIDAASGTWNTKTGRDLTFHPDPERYGSTYSRWLAEKRDWCISRQLWWGHRIPIWSKTLDTSELPEILAALPANDQTRPFYAGWVNLNGEQLDLVTAASLDQTGEAELMICLRDPGADDAPFVALGLEQDPDVLDTWFSSALWPFSTLGWPDPETAAINAGQADTKAAEGRPDALQYYYPGSCLVTGRDIITLWVARMAMFGLYNLGDLPFTDVFIHATILDGKGVRMSKSKGNGIDPVDIVEGYGTDALRYVLCMMQTGMQDIRLPVQAISPFTGNLVDLATAKHGRTIFTYIDPETGQEFDVLGAMADVPAAKTTSDRFEVGRNFCNKLWNATRFALLNLSPRPLLPLDVAALPGEDRWILSRLSHATEAITEALARYRPSVAVERARDLFWNDLCDWYLELIKPRMRDEALAPAAGQVLGYVLDQVLRLLHPMIPFVTETLWGALNEKSPSRGIDRPLATDGLLITAAWPQARKEWQDATLETTFDNARALIEAGREIRASYGVKSSARFPIAVRTSAADAAALTPFLDAAGFLLGASAMTLGPDVARPANAGLRMVGERELMIGDIVDPAVERDRLKKERDQLQKQLMGVDSKLNNDAFMSKAPENVVLIQREKREELLAALAKLEESLAALG